ncbi:hypothetical protein K4G89_22620, partial [Mycobacterium tuberculosis]|nr:hypothetical protein [Mycobacterium tuberculosis]
GNVGINGGNSGARESTYTLTIERLPVLENPVKTAISCFTWTDAIARGPEMTASRDGVRGKTRDEKRRNGARFYSLSLIHIRRCRRSFP